MIVEFESEDDQENNDKDNENVEAPDDLIDTVLEPKGDIDAVSEIERKGDSIIEPVDETGSFLNIDHTPRGYELRSILSAITSEANELERLKRFSDPKDFFARGRRTALQSGLSEKLRQLQKYQSSLEKEVQRCKRNESILQSDYQRITLAEPKEYYSEAEQQQLKQLHEAISDRDAVSWTITKVQSALSSAGMSYWPDSYQYKPDFTFPSRKPESRGFDRAGLSNEVKDLLSSGPLRKNRMHL